MQRPALKWSQSLQLVTPAPYDRSPEKAQREQGHDLGGGQEVGDGDVFVGLMGQDQAARAVADALLNPSAAGDVFLVVCPWANDKAWLCVRDVSDGCGRGARQLAVCATQERVDAHQVAQLIGHALSLEQLDDLGANVVEGLLVDEATIE